MSGRIPALVHAIADAQIARSVELDGQALTTQQDKSVRNHTHDWSKTARPNGFSSLNEHFRDYPGWQFCISANEHGRVHGVIIDDTFYIIWLDHNHNLYP